MSRTFTFGTTILPDWIDYNGHMRDSYFGLVFSLAVDALQDKVGFDKAYRQFTGCTIYLLEDHKTFLKEVKAGALVRVESHVLACDRKRFHLYMQMFDGEVPAAVGEFMELHVAQRPEPRAAAMPEDILATLEAACLSPVQARNLKHRSRRIGF